MSNEQAREIFNKAIANETDADRIAKIEICREYFTNTKFREALQDHLWNNRAA